MTALPVKSAEFEAFDAEMEPELVSGLVKLLDNARRNLDADRDAAAASIARATSLLQVEIDRKAHGVEARAATGPLAGWQIHRVRAYIDAHLEETIFISHLAVIAQRSEAHFCRAFKGSFGVTPHAYIVARRLERAIALMLAGDWPLSEIALSCGFTDQPHLCKVFRARHGASPAAWRRERRDLGGLTPAARLGAPVAAPLVQPGSG